MKYEHSFFAFHFTLSEKKWQINVTIPFYVE